jgi:cytochrome c
MSVVAGHSASEDAGERAYVPATPIIEALSENNRGGWDKPGHDAASNRFNFRIGCSAALALALALPVGVARAADVPHFGQPVSPADIAGWDISIGPDGVGLPPGSGTPAEGAVIYAEKCAACHGDKGEGKTNARLVGGQITGNGPVVKTVGSYWPYATSVFDFIRRAMPWTTPKSLTDHEVYAVTAYILRLNNIIGDNDVMDAKTLPQVKMPNRDGFIPLFPGKH